MQCDEVGDMAFIEFSAVSLAVLKWSMEVVRRLGTARDLISLLRCSARQVNRRGPSPNASAIA